MSRNARRRDRSPCLLLLATTWLVLAYPTNLVANEIVSSNPFDPGRKPWKQEQEKVAPPSLPELTPKDLQIDAIISFGEFRGIIAQLDGRLKGTLPVNAVGKVRIQVGQNFGGGYILSSLEPNHVVIQGNEKRFSIPLLRKVSKGGTPAPTLPAPEQAPIAPAAQPAPVAVGASPSPPPVVPAINPFAGLPSSPSPESPAEAAQPAQPTSLLDAIRQAQEAAKTRANPPQTGNPFAGRQ